LTRFTQHPSLPEIRIDPIIHGMAAIPEKTKEIS
jgi:hypothetical protein